MINPHIFREYDIRGVVEEDFTDENVLLLGKGIGTFLRNNGSESVVIGRDIRESSERIKNGIVAGLRSTGLRVFDIGLAPTPTLYFAVLQHTTGGGVMITGSHNLLQFNGIKIAKKGLGPVFGSHVQEIRDIIERRDFITETTGTYSDLEVLDEYTEILRSKFHFDHPLNIVVDAGNGMASLIMPGLWESLGHDVECLYCELDGTFPNHLPDPQHEKYMTGLAEKVVATGADIGIGYDGDCDRAGFIDDKGRLITSDRVVALLARDVLARHPGAEVIFDPRGSLFLSEEINRLGGELTMWKVGNSPIKAKMLETGAPFAGEFSGHIFYNDESFRLFDDAFYVSGQLLQMLLREGKKFSDLADELPYYESTPEIHLDAPDDRKFTVIADMVAHFKKHYDVIDIDGARVEFNDGWGLVRASNTHPRITLRFEATTKERLKEIIEIFKAKLGEYPEVVFSDEDFTIS